MIQKGYRKNLAQAQKFIRNNEKIRLLLQFLITLINHITQKAHGDHEISPQSLR